MDFIGKRKIWYIVSTVIILAGIISMFVQGLNLGIDFTGGSVSQVKFEQNVEIAQLRSVIHDLDMGSNRIQELDDGSYQIKTVYLDQTALDNFIVTLEQKLGACELMRSEAVSASVGSELLRGGLIALAVAILMMLIYITWRFEWRFALSSIVPLIHDVLVVLSLFSIFQLEVESYFIAAILTIFGYSVNATIVVFDRIRENVVSVKKDQLKEVVNKSIMQSMTRTINTSVTTLILILAVLILGGQTTRVFMVALAIGVVCGAYSSVCLASSIWYDISMKGKSKRVAVK